MHFLSDVPCHLPCNRNSDAPGHLRVALLWDRLGNFTLILHGLKRDSTDALPDALSVPHPDSKVSFMAVSVSSWLSLLSFVSSLHNTLFAPLLSLFLRRHTPLTNSASSKARTQCFLANTDEDVVSRCLPASPRLDPVSTWSAVHAADTEYDDTTTPCASPATPDADGSMMPISPYLCHRRSFRCQHHHNILATSSIVSWRGTDCERPSVLRRCTV